jgi:hypothetical protein
MALDHNGFDPPTLVYWRKRLVKSERPHWINEAVRKSSRRPGSCVGGANARWTPLSWPTRSPPRTPSPNWCDGSPVRVRASSRVPRRDLMQGGGSRQERRGCFLALLTRRNARLDTLIEPPLAGQQRYVGTGD